MTFLMSYLVTFRQKLISMLVLLFPLGLWAMLWVSIQPGNPANILNPNFSLSFAHVLRGFLPFAAAGMALMIIIFKLYKREPTNFKKVGPLVFLSLYGLIGISASLNSPELLVSLYWGVSYLTVPIVLFIIFWRKDALKIISNIIYINWILLTTVVLVLFCSAFIYLGYSELLFDPSKIVSCPWGTDWFQFYIFGEKNILRSTGVGRYAGIIAIISLSLMWSKKYRNFWGVVLFASLVLLAGSFARAAVVSAVVAVPAVFLLHGGKKQLLILGVVSVAVISMVWSIGGSKYLADCWFRGWSPVISIANPESPAVVANELLSGKDVTGSVIDTAGDDVGEGRLPPDKKVNGSVIDAARMDVDVGGNRSPPNKEVNPRSVDGLEKAGSSLTQIPNRGFVTADNPNHLNGSEDLVGKERTRSIIPVETVSSVASQRGWIAEGFYTFTGRTVVWAVGWDLIVSSPVVGYGFHADRLLLEEHMHNAVLQALIQTGFIGTFLFVGAFVYVAILIIKISKFQCYLPMEHKQMFVQSVAILILLCVRSIWESSGAFFGVDLLILAPLLIYLQILATYSDPEQWGSGVESKRN